MNMRFDNRQFIARFKEETQEHIQKINDSLLQLEKRPIEGTSYILFVKRKSKKK
jgi:hypothetical protein